MKKNTSRVIVSREKINELVELSEEKDISIITAKSLSLYLTLLKKQSQGYILGLIPTDMDKETLIIDLSVI